MQRRFFTLLAACLVFFTFTSCNNIKIKRLVAGINQTCPLPFGDMGTMTGAQYEKNTVIFCYDLEHLNFDAIKQNDSEFRNYMLSNYRNSYDEDFVKTYTTIAESGSDLVLRLKQGDNTTDVRLTNEELKANMPQGKSDPENELQLLMAGSRMQLPLHVAEGMVGTDMKIEDKCFAYVFECDESIYNMGELKTNVLQTHDALLEVINNGEKSTFTNLVDLLRKTGRGLEYRYIGTTSGDSAVMCITPEELQAK